eukprot:6179534-Pleurochrysis_carterae.AAC.3
MQPLLRFRTAEVQTGYFVYLFDMNCFTTVRFSEVKFDESVLPEVKSITGTFVSYTTRYSLPSVAQ